MPLDLDLNYQPLAHRLRTAIASHDQAALLELAGDLKDASDRLAMLAHGTRAWLDVELSRAGSSIGAPDKETLDYAASLLAVLAVLR